MNTPEDTSSDGGVRRGDEDNRPDNEPEPDAKTDAEGTAGPSAADEDDAAPEAGENADRPGEAGTDDTQVADPPTDPDVTLVPAGRSQDAAEPSAAPEAGSDDPPTEDNHPDTDVTLVPSARTASADDEPAGDETPEPGTDAAVDSDVDGAPEGDDATGDSDDDTDEPGGDATGASDDADDSDGADDSGGGGDSEPKGDDDEGSDDDSDDEPPELDSEDRPEDGADEDTGPEDLDPARPDDDTIVEDDATESDESDESDEPTSTSEPEPDDDEAATSEPEPDDDDEATTGDEGAATPTTPLAVLGNRASEWAGLVGSLPTRTLFPLAVAACLVLLFLAWGIDSAQHAGQVARNVSLAGHSLGGTADADLADEVAAIADELDSRQVTVLVDGEEVASNRTAAEMGVLVNQEAVEDAARSAGRTAPLPLRPFSWLGSLFSDHQVASEYEVNELQAVAELDAAYRAAVSADHITLATNPRVVPDDSGDGGPFVVEPGSDGQGLDTDLALAELQAAIEGSAGADDELVVPIETVDLSPEFSDAEAEALADELNEATADPLSLVANGEEREVEPEELSSWVTPVVDPADGETRGLLLDQVDGEPDEIEEVEPLSWEFDHVAAEARVEELFTDINSPPVNARPVLTGDGIDVAPSEEGVSCCSDGSQAIEQALRDGASEAELEIEVVEPEFSTEAVEDMGIEEPVGAARGWRAGEGDVEGPRPGFTTWQVGSGGRAHNIGQMAQDVDGSWIAPGGTWSINDHVGARSCPPYQSGGAIVEGEMEEVCGGGTSQFATTMLNAAYFAGLDVTGRAHSQYFSRYPRGREATMGAPGTPLDVTLTNNTPYGVYIQSVRHGDEVTVTLWSTSHIEVAQTGISERSSGECTYVTTTRTRTYPDGSTEEDTFSGAYGPGGEVRC